MIDLYGDMHNEESFVCFQFFGHKHMKSMGRLFSGPVKAWPPVIKQSQSEPHDGNEVIPECRKCKTWLHFLLQQHRELPIGTHSSSTISQQKQCHCKETNNDYYVDIPFLTMQSFLVH